MIEERYRMGTGFALVGAGVVVAVLGYLGVSSETEVAFQLPYFASAAVGALLLFGAGAGLLLSTQLSRDGDRIADLEEAVRQLTTEVARLVDETSPPRRGAEASRSNGRARTAKSIRRG